MNMYMHLVYVKFTSRHRANIITVRKWLTSRWQMKYLIRFGNYLYRWVQKSTSRNTTLVLFNCFLSSPDDLIYADDYWIIAVGNQCLSHVHYDVHPDHLIRLCEHAHGHHTAHFVARFYHCKENTRLVNEVVDN